MATSSAVTTGQQATAAQYNNLRTDMLGNLEYTELVSTTHVVTNNNTWEDWDVSGIVPAGTTEVELWINLLTGGNYGARKNGSALNRYFEWSVAAGWITMWVPLDSSRICEIYAPNTASTFQVIGYLTRL